MADGTSLLMSGSPDQRRRQSGNALAMQFDRPATWEGDYVGPALNTVAGADWFPAGNYRQPDGSVQTGPAFPGALRGGDELPALGDRSPEAADTIGRFVLANALFPGAGRAAGGVPSNALGSMGGRLRRPARDAKKWGELGQAVDDEPWRVSDLVAELANAPPVKGPYQGYRGSAYENLVPPRGPLWGSSNPNVASTYAFEFGSGIGFDSYPRLAPLEFRFKNPMTVNANKAEYTHIPFAGDVETSDELARRAMKQGHDGLIIKNVLDTARGGGRPATTYAALQRGTTYSPMTGELIYADTGLPVGAANALYQQTYAGQQPQPSAPQWQSSVRPNDT